MGGGILQAATSVRKRLMHVYEQQGLHGDAFATVAAMTLGEKQRVGRELRETYNISGASHVFALSGLHLSIFFMLLTVLLPWFLPTTGWHNAGIMMALAVMWMYVVMVGFHASVVRAAVMLTLYSVAHIAGRFTNGIDTVMVTAFLLLLVRPHWLFEAGFQMSMLAVISIILLYSGIYYTILRAVSGIPGVRGIVIPPGKTGLLGRHSNTLFYKKRVMVTDVLVRFMVSVFSVSLAAQIGVAPLVAYYFHRFSCYFWLTNMLVSPLAMVIIVLALLLLLTAMLPAALSWTASAVAAVLLFVVNGQNFFLRWVAQLPGASIENIRLNAVQLVLIYVIIASTVLILPRLRNVFLPKNLEK